jgi:glycosyltransferase
MKKLSVVVSVYNEVQVIELFYQELSRVLRELDCASETIYVNDGSTDGSFEKLELLTVLDKNVKLISFARNFGHEAAMIAGIDYSEGDCIICMDADLQHPVDLIFEIVKKFEEGYEVITMKRTQNKETGFLKTLISDGFYKVQNLISDEHFEENVSDFFAISKKTAYVLKTQYREKVRFLRGHIQNMDYRRTSISYEAGERAAGTSKYSI